MSRHTGRGQLAARSLAARLLAGGLLAGTVLAFVLAPGAPRAAAQDNDWTAPQLIFEGAGRVDWPWLIPDQYGQLHAFWGFTSEDNTRNLLYYTRLDRPGTPIVDIVSTNVVVRSIFGVTSPGGLLLTWAGRQYVRASENPEYTARAWSGPHNIAQSYANAGVATAPDGAVWLLSGLTDNNAIFTQRLDTQTEQWSDPKLVANTMNTYSAPDAMRLAISEEGILHAVWAEYKLPDGWPPLGVYYAQSSDEGASWSSPRPIASGLYTQPNILAGPDHKLYLMWLGAVGQGGRYFQQSDDDGRTWTEPVEVINSRAGGSQGAPAMALDSEGRLHTVFTDDLCVYYTRLDPTGWLQPECISQDLPANAVKEYPAMAISQGNRIDVLLDTNRTQLWHIWRYLDAPSVAAVASPSPVPATSTPVPATPIPDAPTPTPLPDYGPFPDPNLPSRTGLMAVATGVAPILILFAALVGRRLRKHK